MLRRLAHAFALVALVFASGFGTAAAQTTFQPPPPYQSPDYRPAPYAPSPAVQQQSLPSPPPAPPAATAPSAPAPPSAAPTAELPLGPPSPTPSPAAAPSSADEAAAIRDAIDGWAKGFNALKSAIVCGIFAADLQYDFGTQPGDYNSLCKKLKQALGETGIRYRYTPNIQEIVISGTMAVVRLVWTLTITRTNHTAPTEVTEPAMFVMRHDPDGNWRVFRFLAFVVANPPQH